MRELVTDWSRTTSHSDLDDTFVLTGTRLDATELNREIQLARFKRDELGIERVHVGPYMLHVGDRVRFRRNAGEVINGDRGVVTSVAEDDRVLTVELRGGKRVEIDLDSYDDIDLGYA